VKILYPDCISSVVAQTSDADYPDENMLNEHPQKPWKAEAGTGYTCVVRLITDGSAVSGVGIFNTNATAITVWVKNADETVDYETHSLTSVYGRYFLEFTSSYNEVLHVTISLTTPTTTAYIGCARCGPFISIPNPKASGVNFGRDDYSIKHELSNGGLYIFKRNTPRSFSLSFDMLQTEFETIDALFDITGSHPMAMLVAENMADDNKWCGFFHIAEPPAADYAYPQHTGCSIDLKEAV
jgi:hypothetical protein